MNTLIRLSLIIILVILVAFYVELMGLEESTVEELSQQIDTRMDESESMLTQQIGQLASAVSALERTVASLDRRLAGAQIEDLAGVDASDPVATADQLIEEAAANPRAVLYSSRASGPAAAGMAGVAANSRFGPVLDSLGLDDETRRLAMEALTEIMTERTRAGMDVVIDQSIDEYLATRKTQEQLDQETRQALADVLTRAQIDQVIAQQDVNREVRARQELRGAEQQLEALGLSDASASLVMQTLVDNFKFAQTIDWPSIGGGQPTPMQIAYTANEAKIDGIFLARESLESELSGDELLAVDEVLSNLVNTANAQVEAARQQVNFNAGIEPDQ